MYKAKDKQTTTKKGYFSYSVIFRMFVYCLNAQDFFHDLHFGDKNWKFFCIFKILADTVTEHEEEECTQLNCCLARLNSRIIYYEQVVL